jgi:hypothetical protein
MEQGFHWAVAVIELFKEPSSLQNFKIHYFYQKNLITKSYFEVF